MTSIKECALVLMTHGPGLKNTAKPSQINTFRAYMYTQLQIKMEFINYLVVNKGIPVWKKNQDLAQASYMKTQKVEFGHDKDVVRIDLLRGSLFPLTLEVVGAGGAFVYKKRQTESHF